MHKQLLYVVKKTKILNKENHNNEVNTRTETNKGALLYHFKIYTSNRQSMNENINLYVSFIIFSGMTFKVLLRSNYRYSFFYIFVYNMTFLHILPNFSPLRTLEVILFLLLFPRIYGRHYLTLFQGLDAN